LSRRPLLVALCALQLAGCAAGSAGQYGERRDRHRDELVANPSAVIAAELAFARMAREKGTWTAFRETSTDDALWPSPPGYANVHQDLKDVPNPPQPILWGPDAVWLSCDGSFALSTGPATQPDGRRGRFATIWQRQRDEDYEWVLDQGFDLEEGYTEPEMIGARVADCPPGMRRDRRRAKRPEVQRGGAWQSGRSNDGTLEWNTELAADCHRTLIVRANQGGTMTEVFRRVSPPPRAPEGQPAPTCSA
jgi:hypothetical protein